MKPNAGRLVILALALSSSAALRGQTYDLWHSFEPPGPDKPNGLIQGSDGLYGTTSIGGDASNCSGGCGTVFRMDGDGIVTTIHAFKIEDDGSSPDGYHPYGDLLLASSGDLYGTTTDGGSATCNCGTVFRIDSNGTFATVHTFEGLDGRHPFSTLIEPQAGDLWGTTSEGGDLTCPDGGPGGCGTVFRMHLNGDLQTMHEFSDVDGNDPSTRLLLADDGNLYGTTWAGGKADAGNVFRITLNGNLTVIHEFSGFSLPEPLIQARSGDLIGTLHTGDGGHNGSVYRMTLDGDFQILHSFDADGHEGILPDAPVFQADDGFFYGTTLEGGKIDHGTVFQLGEDGTLTTIHDFVDDTDGVFPSSTLMQAADQRLYGTTPSGGTGDAGTVFRITLPGVVHRFYCPTTFVRRDQMAVFLLKIEHGADHVPPDCTGQFPDVACPGLFASWIEELAAEGITAGCGGGDYCPLSPITRAQMAVFLLKTEHGSAYSPPPCSGTFPDVACPSLFGAWIEQLAAEGITSGCGLGNFCPDSPVTRAQMAVFLLKLEHGAAFAPPDCQSVFADVPCPSPFADWIETLFAEAITAGCAGT